MPARLPPPPQWFTATMERDAAALDGGWIDRRRLVTGTVSRAGPTFGFIQPDDGRDRVYYNIAAVVGGVNLSWGDRVSYFLGAAPDYRPRACEVTLLGTRG